MFVKNGPFSYSPRGFSPEDLPQQRRAFDHDDLKGAPLQRNGMFRPSGRAIYIQRKEYSDVLNRQSDNFNVRVEHLFTCEMDGKEVKTEDECVAKLKRLDGKGRLWPQEMIMEIQGGYLVLSDIETKAELESLPFSRILKTKAVLDSCAYNSVLMITVQDRSKGSAQVFMFQCEETGAELIKSDLDKLLQTRGGEEEPRREQSDIRSDLENIIGQRAPGSFRQVGPRAVLRDRTPPPPDHPPPHWGTREPENIPSPRAFTPQEPPIYLPDPRELQSSPEVPFSPEQMASETNVAGEILNHVIADLEIFMNKVSAAVNTPTPQNAKNKKSLLKKKKSKQNAPPANLPPWEEYVYTLQKVKYGFNLLGQLQGTLTGPSAEDFVHIFFTSLNMMVPLYPADLPPTVVSPLLTVTAIQLLSQCITPEEDTLWASLGESWNLSRSKWPGEVPPYIPQFYDGWQPPPPQKPSPVPFQNGPMSRSNSQRFPPGRGPPGEPVANGPWSSAAPPPQPTEPPLYMQVMYDFMARNNQELTIMKGEEVQVIQKSKQWWLVRNDRGEQGYVPQNVLESLQRPGHMEDFPNSHSPVNLDMTSSPAEVRAWLEYKGFSKITVRSLGVLNGQQLLGMNKNEIRGVCPEDGARVFFQLQGVKSAIALASEPSSMYNGHY